MCILFGVVNAVTISYVVSAIWLPYTVGTGLLCLFFNLLCYAAVLIKFTYYAQNYAQE